MSTIARGIPIVLGADVPDAAGPAAARTRGLLPGTGLLEILGTGVLPLVRTVARGGSIAPFRRAPNALPAAGPLDQIATCAGHPWSDTGLPIG